MPLNRYLVSRAFRTQTPSNFHHKRDRRVWIMVLHWRLLNEHAAPMEPKTIDHKINLSVESLIIIAAFTVSQSSVE